MASNQAARAIDQPLELGQAHEPKARAALLRRLCEIVAWPETKLPNNERQLAADILLGLLRTSSADIRRRCADGLQRVHDAPKALLRYLARDEIGVAASLLENGVGFDDSDLIAVVRSGVSAHWRVIARRRALNETVTDALIQTGDIDVIETVLKNKGSRLSMQGVDAAVMRSRDARALAPLIAARSETRPTQALVLFWWSGFETRTQILRRFAVDRLTLLQELGDVFRLASAEGFAEADTRKALQVIERRQRNRLAAERSPFGSLEGAIAAARNGGVTNSLLNEIAHLCGVKPRTAQQILTDPGGEAVGVLCKAVGLKRPFMLDLWTALGRPPGDISQTDNALGRAVFTFDSLATAKAQTVLRYWNWSFTSDPVGADGARFDDEAFAASPARRNAALVLGALD
jgi:uncharacterized protein (DUF2336 family)